MHSPSLFAMLLLLVSVSGVAPGWAQDAPLTPKQTETVRRYGLDPRSPLDSRVGEASPAVMKLFEGVKVRPTAHVLTEDERGKLSVAFSSLPPLHRRVLGARLRSISFLDGMPNTGMTSAVNPNESYRLFDITIRAGILHQTVSEWLTEKERSVFDASGSPVSVSVEAGTNPALEYVLLHEASHILDFCLMLTPPYSEDRSAVLTLPTAFTQGVWERRTTPAAPYRDPLRESVRFYTGRKVRMARAEAVYLALRRTPFVSLYGGGNWHDDLAEYATIYHWTEVLKQPYRIVLRDGDREIFSYEPMKSELVRQRAGQMKAFYGEGPV